MPGCVRVGDDKCTVSEPPPSCLPLVLNFGFIGWKSSKCSFNYICKFGRVSKAAASVDYVLGLPAAVGIGVSGVPAIVGIGFRLWYQKSLLA